MKRKTGRRKIAIICYGLDKSVQFEEVACRLNPDLFSQKYLFLKLHARKSDFESFLDTAGIPYLTIRCDRGSRYPWAFIRIFIELIRYRPHVVHTHLLIANYLGLLAARIALVKRRYYTRHHSIEHHLVSKKAVWADRICNSLATKAIAISPMVGRILVEKEHLSADKVYLLPHGFNLDLFSKVDAAQVSGIRAKHAIPSDRVVIGVVSRFVVWKGYQYIIPAFQRLYAEHPEVHLVIAGNNGVYRAAVEQLLSSLPQGSYTVVGFEPNSYALYKTFDLFVHVPIGPEREAFGQIYIEALAAGVPSIVTLSGIAPEIMRHKENAWVVPFEDSAAIYTGLKTLLLDTDLRNRLVNQGKKDVAPYGIDIMVKRLEELYSS
ncbi:MAG: glycosyltransferase [Sphingobacteriia bacterium]